jgi:hypothetical protein
MKHNTIVILGFALAVFPTATSAQRDPLNPHGVLTAPIGCEACHNTGGWIPTKDPLDFDHDTDTGFRLDGAHGVVPCATCHIDVMFDEPKLSEGVCTTCHIDVHRGRLSPDCQSCHNTTVFADVAGLEVHARTSFPLSGAHQQLSCESCHPNDAAGAYSTQATDCIACHSAEYEESQFVDHTTVGFSTECQECHTNLAWSHSVNFDHVTFSNGFALLGRHADLRCSSCHSQGIDGSIFSPTGQDDCIACHQGDYENEHGTSGFPTTCLVCHSYDTWEGATFEDHDEQFFPIFSGAHRSQWDGCETCHDTPGDFRQFTCLVCHEHRQSAMDDKHNEEVGYVYESTACYSCHPNGRHEG